MSRLVAPLLLLALAAALLACGSGAGEPPVPQAAAPAQPEDFVAEGPHPVAVLQMGELGTIRIQLLPEVAPKAVAYFSELVAEGVYDGTTFHRVVPGSMIQGGDPLTRNADPRDDGRGRTGRTAPDEFGAYPHVRGTVSLAHKGSRGTADCQFFIVHEDMRHLDGQYTAFGRVIEGMDVVDAITRLEIDQFGRYGPPNRPYPVEARMVDVRIDAPGAPEALAGAAATDPSDS